MQAIEDGAKHIARSECYGETINLNSKALEEGRQKIMPHTYTNLLTHIVFSTKNREPFLTAKYRPRVYEYIGGTVRGLGGICIEVGGIEDHIHMLVKLKPTMNVSKFLQDLKPNITKWARANINSRFEWQNGYGAFSVSESQVEKVRRYIRNQENHHKKMNFEQEFVGLLSRSGIEYERKFLWK